MVIASPLTAQEEVLILDGPRLPTTLEGKISYFLDPTRALSIEDVLSGKGPKLAPVTTAFPDFDYVDENIWLRMTLRNETQDVHSWRIHFRENFKQELAVYVVRDGQPVETVYDVGLNDGFAKRPIQYPEMVAPMELTPGETAEVYVRYWSEGSSHLAFGFETDVSFAQRAATRTAKNFLYYGMMIIPMFMAFLAFLVYRHGVFIAYIANWMSGLLYVMHTDGVTFQYFWPNSPVLNSYASIPLGAAIIISAPMFARLFLNTRRNHPVMDKLLWGVILLAVLMVVSSTFADRQMLKKLLVLLSLIAVSMCVLSGFVAAFTRFKEVRFFVLAWAGFLVAATIMSMRHWLGIEISQDFQTDAIRTVLVVDATLMGLSIVDRYNQLRLSRQKAITARYDEENRNLKLLARLSELEKRYALEMGDMRQRDIASADTLHDLQQPLTALRLTIRQMVDGDQSTPIAAEDTEGAFAYIEQLMSEASERRRTGPDEAPDAEPEQDHFGLRKVSDSVFQMFLPDAAAKGIDLRYYPSKHDVTVEPLAAMRVISNILSNAVKFTETGRILFCVRKRADGLRVEVHDSGPGLSQAEFDQAKARNTRLFATAEGKEGEGLGLAIVHQIAESSGYSVKRLCNRRGGLSIGVTFPPDGPAG